MHISMNFPAITSCVSWCGLLWKVKAFHQSLQSAHPFTPHLPLSHPLHGLSGKFTVPPINCQAVFIVGHHIQSFPTSIICWQTIPMETESLLFVWQGRPPERLRRQGQPVTKLRQQGWHIIFFLLCLGKTTAATFGGAMPLSEGMLQRWGLHCWHRQPRPATATSCRCNVRGREDAASASAATTTASRPSF